MNITDFVNAVNMVMDGSHLHVTPQPLPPLPTDPVNCVEKSELDTWLGPGPHGVHKGKGLSGATGLSDDHVIPHPPSSLSHGEPPPFIAFVDADPWLSALLAAVSRCRGRRLCADWSDCVPRKWRKARKTGCGFQTLYQLISAFFPPGASSHTPPVWFYFQRCLSQM